MMLAAITKQSTLIITEEESEKLAAAINRVAELYEAPFLTEEARAWMALSMVGIEVYGTRVAAAIVEAKSRRPQGVVTPIRHTPHNSPPQQPIPPMEAYTEREASE
jgi:hypothetical protein